MQCICFCVSQQIRLSSFENELKRQRHRYEKFLDVLQLFGATEEVCFYFSNGTIVMWGVPKARVSNYLDIVGPFLERKFKTIQKDAYIYRYGDRLEVTAHAYFSAELLTLESEDVDVKLALSYAFSQSIRLQASERIVEGLVDTYMPLVEQLSNTGHIYASRRRLRKIIGEILAAKSLINLKHGFTYQPKFFWEKPNLEKEYLLLRQYLDISVRVEGFNQQLDTLSEILQLLNGYLEGRHSHFLEIIIILLILLEIIFGVLHLQL